MERTNVIQLLWYAWMFFVVCFAMFINFIFPYGYFYFMILGGVGILTCFFTVYMVWECYVGERK